MARSVDDIEKRYGITLSAPHRLALLNSSDRIHKRTLLLTPEGNKCQSIFSVNDDLRLLEWKQWPDYLVAFATSECGDYFAFDTRTFPYRIYYIDPNDTAPQSIASNEQSGYVFESFEQWYADQTQVG